MPINITLTNGERQELYKLLDKLGDYQTIRERVAMNENHALMLQKLLIRLKNAI